MADVVDKATRSRMMAGIKGKDTKPELLIRRGLHRLGFRFRLHDGALPGRPDLVFRSRKAVIFVNGCFWHGHDCPRFKMPSTRPDFWASKIDANKARDELNRRQVEVSGWRHATIWECALSGRGRRDLATLLGRLARWIDRGRRRLDISGSRR